MTTNTETMTAEFITAETETGIICPNCGKVHGPNDFAGLDEECQLIFAVTHDFEPKTKNIPVYAGQLPEVYECPVCGNDTVLSGASNAGRPVDGGIESVQKCEHCGALNTVIAYE